mmetsp:Transcript_81274/g.197025  ORF Transcript_81274/g.197025 Transcript_81274/m.197025 type:complete len:219 (+) Transcript_81274:4618-5274(+)
MVNRHVECQAKNGSKRLCPLDSLPHIRNSANSRQPICIGHKQAKITLHRVSTECDCPGITTLRVRARTTDINGVHRRKGHQGFANTARTRRICIECDWDCCPGGVREREGSRQPVARLLLINHNLGTNTSKRRRCREQRNITVLVQDADGPGVPTLCVSIFCPGHRNRPRWRLEQWLQGRFHDQISGIPLDRSRSKVAQRHGERVAEHVTSSFDRSFT